MWPQFAPQGDHERQKEQQVTIEITRQKKGHGIREYRCSQKHHRGIRSKCSAPHQPAKRTPDQRKNRDNPASGHGADYHPQHAWITGECAQLSRHGVKKREWPDPGGVNGIVFQIGRQPAHEHLDARQ